jgi:hypothetical protein
MEGNILVLIAVSLAIGLIVLGIIAMIGSGIKSLSQGKQDVNRIVIMAVPFIIFGISYAVLQDVSKAGVLTTMCMMVIMVVSVAFTGLRGTFKF